MKNFVQKGDRLNFVESTLVHPVHGDGLVNGDDPVVCGRVAGVADFDAVAATDTIVVDTVGVFDLSVTSVGNGVSLGETVFIDPVAGTLSEDPTDVPFGVALDTVNALATKVIPIRLFGATPGATGYGS